MKSLFLSLAVLGLVVAAAIAQEDPTPTPSDEFKCPDHNDAKFPDPKDCSRYYVCTNGLAWHESCPVGTLFDPVTLDCNFPWLVNCESTAPTNPATTPPPSSTAGTNPPSTEGPTTPPPTTDSPPQSSTQEPPPTSEEPVITDGTPSPTTDGPAPSTTAAPPTTSSGDFECPNLDGFFPHPLFCHLYYVCVQGFPYLEQCPEGLWFDPVLTLCNWPDQVQCDTAP